LREGFFPSSCPACADDTHQNPAIGQGIKKPNMAHPNDKYFDVFPLIVLSGQKSSITIRPLFDHVLFEAIPEVTVLPAEGMLNETVKPKPAPVPSNLKDGKLTFEYDFKLEQEYTVLVRAGQEQHVFRLYALEKDLFERKPYKGDLHIHTCRSDGKESPAYVAGAGRRIGYDFMAITDHHRYEPSLEAMKVYENAPIDLRLYPGEEVHPPENPVHMVNFGGSFSVNDLFGHPEYREEVQSIADSLEDFPEGADRYAFASCSWCYEQIREGGGLGLFCHPYWYAGYRYDVPEALTTLLLDRQPFDALELIGGYHPYEVESNMLQVARYHDERAKGRKLPIVGVTDGHGCETGELFGWYYTVVFSQSLELSDLIGSIKNLYSVAVEAMPESTPRAHGPFRLAKYAQFLLREVFPLHDALCQEEGRLMLAYAAGDSSAANLLSQLQGRTEKLYSRLWKA